MHAVIRTGGKQYYVTAGDILEVEKLTGDVGETITLSDILMVANDEDVTVGQPTVADAAVTARITGQYRGNKILVFRYRPKKRIRVRRGHRQYLTRLEIQSIKLGEHEFVAPVPAIAEPPVAVEPTVETQVEEEAMTPYAAASEVTASEDVASEANLEAGAVDAVAADADEEAATDGSEIDTGAPEADAGAERADQQ